MKRPRVRIAWVMAAILGAAIVFASLRYASSAWAGAIVLITLGALAWAALAAVYLRDAAGAFWLGFAVFGSAYMLLTAGVWWQANPYQSDLPTTRLLAGAFLYLDPRYDPDADGAGPPRPSNFFRVLLRDPDAPNRRLRALLERRVAMPFAKKTPLEDVLNYLQVATAGVGQTKGFHHYVDPDGLMRAGRSMTSPVTLDAEDVPLRVALRLILDQLGLAYHVEDGLLIIQDKTQNDPRIEPDSFLRIGHCWWAWISGLIGGYAGVSLRVRGRASQSSRI